MTTTQKFSVLWCNHTLTLNRDMNRHTFTLRKGLTGSRLHLDQVTILFNPSDKVQAAGIPFAPGDNVDMTWRVETAQLLVRTHPGVEHTLYANEGTITPLFEQSLRAPIKAVTYSSALALTPNVEGMEDYWQRTYRPIRDLPIAFDLDGVTELTVELLFPLLITSTLAETLFSTVPNYRILKVYCEFSLDS